MCELDEVMVCAVSVSVQYDLSLCRCSMVHVLICCYICLEKSDRRNHKNHTAHMQTSQSPTLLLERLGQKTIMQLDEDHTMTDGLRILLCHYPLAIQESTLRQGVAQS